MPLTNIFNSRIVPDEELAWLRSCSQQYLLNKGLSLELIDRLKSDSFLHLRDSPKRPPPEILEDRAQPIRDRISTYEARRLQEDTIASREAALHAMDAFSPSVGSAQESLRAIAARHSSNSPSRNDGYIPRPDSGRIEQSIMGVVPPAQPVPISFFDTEDNNGGSTDSRDVYNEHPSDIERKYQGCYLHYKGVVYLVIGVGNKSNGDIIIDLRNVLNGNRSTLKYKDVTFTLPKLGYINYGNYTLFIERSHKKRDGRYKRGFSPWHVDVSSISDRELRACYGSYEVDPLEVHREDLFNKIGNALYNRTFPSYQEALKSLLDLEVLSCALSTTICLQLNSYKNKFVILKNKWTLGEYDEKKNKWILYNSYFTKDLDNLGIDNYEVMHEQG